MKIHVITRSTRLQNLKTVKESTFNKIPKGVKIEWHVVFDTATLKDIDAELLSDLKDNLTNYYFKRGDADGMLYPQCSEIISKFKSGWVYFLDDDNIIHNGFYDYILDISNKNPEKKVHVVSQNVENKDFSGLDYRMGSPEFTKKHQIDLAQYIVHTDVYNKEGYKFLPDYCADGILIESVHRNNPEWFTYTPTVLSHYNYLQKESSAKVPKVLYIGKDEPELKSLKILDYEADNLDVRYLKNDSEIVINLAQFNPDVIISRGKSWEDFPNLGAMPLQFRRKWMNMPKERTIEEVGQAAYQCAMTTMLDKDSVEDSEMISYTTPIYNTGDKLYNTYQSLLEQTYSNWEWVLLNDSTDGGRTLKIAEDIASRDPRVKVYDFREKSGGLIGEVKWRANCMARGFILAELDHDDLLVPWCTEDLYKAAKKHPEAGFFFNDTLEVNEDWESQTYPDGFAFAYGSYREEEYKGQMMHVANQHNINPKTIRHIVGVPNHVRAWRRSTYFEIGGHNRNLAVADDYELVVRTFLKTITCKIPKLGYVQFLYNNANGQNTHDMARADIQRRVRTIGYYYNEQIKDRFTDLGLHDWAYEENPHAPLHTPPRYGEDEMAANIVYNENE
jgi:glycosyltransferase involved in cell wall biosynthesis|tara:strand:+ start:1628 stop:3478 length:1851 start_codon:yes stop_codon:yes gene_type:complete